MFTIYASNYAPINPLVPPCDINLIPIGYVGENLARCLVFDLSECVEQFGDGGFVISFLRHGDELPYLVTNTDRLEDNAIWNITDTDTAVDGYGLVQLQYIVDEVVCKSALYRTVTFESNGITGDVPDPYEDLLAQIAAYASTAQSSAAAAVAAAATATTAVEEGVKTERSQRIAADEGLSARIDSLQASVGAPLTTTQASAMTDVNKIYVYTGSETGYTFGNWYYYNGAEWVSGGVYNSQALETDKTLTVSNMAADAAVVGEKIDECMAAFVTETVSGSIASFADGADGVPLKDLVVNISPVQSGTGDPSPSNVRAISGWTEANIYRTGKNLLEYTITSGTYSGLTCTLINDNGGTTGVTLNGTSTGSPAAIRLGYLKKSGSLKVVISATPSTSGSFRFTIEANKNGSNSYLNTTWYYPNNGKQTFDINVADGYDTYRLVLWIGNGYSASNLAVNVMVVDANETDDTFEPYNGNTYNVSFGSAGTVYIGTFDVLSGILTVTYSGVDLGSLSWVLSTSYSHMFAAQRPGAKIQGQSICSCYKSSNHTPSQLLEGEVSLNPTGYSSSPYILIKESGYSDAASFKTAMSGQTLVYELAQPVSYPLTAHDIRTLLGNNNIFADCGTVDCEYRADTRLYIEKLTTPDDDMVANANITSGSYFMVGNNLYLATANIANGGAITPGTNCTATNLAAALNAINS